MLDGASSTAKILSAVKPKIGGCIVGAWLGGIIGNLLLGRNHYEISLRDFGLLLAGVSASEAGDG